MTHNESDLSAKFLSHLRQLGVRVWVDAGRLRYQAAKGVMSAELLAELKMRKEEIMAFIAMTERQQRPQPVEFCVQPVSRAEPLPLSLAQKRLWFLEQFHGASGVYNIAGAFVVRGRIDTEALRKSLTEIVRRHESLRTTFGAGPVQIIAPADEIDMVLPCCDLRHLPAAERELEVRRLIRLEAEQPFDLAADLLMRASLLQVADEQHIFLMTFHHIGTDGRSIGVFNEELKTLYAAYVNGRPVVLDRLPVQYADYAVSQLGWLEGESAEKSLAYWVERLKDAPEFLPLPYDYSRPPVQTFAGSVCSNRIDEALLASLRHFAQSEGATTYIVLQAALSAFLGRYSNQKDLMTGLAVGNRPDEQLSKLIGFFVNTIVIRADLSERPTFRQLLRQVRTTVLEAFEHQSTPFERLVEALGAERDMSYTPLIQVMVSWLDGQQGVPDLLDLQIEPFEGETVPARFDLTLEVYATAQQLELMWLYNRDLFKPDSVKRLMGNFKLFLAALIENPDEPVAHAPLMAISELTQVTQTFNATMQPYPKDSCLHHLIEAQVARTPDHIALVFEGESLTFRELDERSNRLANALIERGVTVGCFVGVAMERSFDLVIALYGILKSGGAYVPFEPTYPAERLNFMLADAQVALIVTQAHLRTQFASSEATLICLDDAAAASTQRPNSGVTADDLAYMIYTSGSTGRPKGALNRHSGVVNRLLWAEATFKLSADDRVLQKTPFSFDVSLTEFFGPLISGATLVIAKPEGHKDSRYLAQIIEQEHITTIHFVPSMLALFLDEPGLEQKTASLCRVMCSGEALPFGLQERFFERIGAELHNLYGPTEAAIDVTHWHCLSGGEESIVPIGRPVANTYILIVDEYGQPVPLGVAGELLIGGVQVGAGYWQRPELTAEKFLAVGEGKVSHGALAADPLAVIYRSGDLARWRTDGTIEYLGRIDSQIKLRGFRIELGEIEAALLAQPAVREATVILRHDLPGGAQLVAYVTAEGALDSTGLQVSLRTQLPGYMVPAFVVQLDKMPLSHNGKVDRKLLPLPIRQVATATSEDRRPMTALEANLSRIWGELLQLDGVGLDDNFFDLGGHSLLAMQVVSHIEAELGVVLPVRSLFESPTVAQLARVIDDTPSAGASSLPAILPLERDASALFELSFAQKRLWILSQLSGQESAYHVSSALRLTGYLNLDALQKSLDVLVARHETLRSSFVWQDGGPKQRVYPTGSIVLNKMRLPADVDESVVMAMVVESNQQVFDLSQPELLRLTLLQRSETDSILLLTFHHIITDGWSLNLFVQEWVSLYTSINLDPSAVPDLPPLPIQYVDYAAWQHICLTDTVLAPQIDYWRNRLTGLPPLLNLPTDHPRPPVQTSDGRIKYFEFDETLTAALRQLARQHDVTLFMALLAGFGALLARYSNQDDVPIGSGIANRNRPEIETLLGFFVNTLVMRIDTSGTPTFSQLLERVRDVTLEAYAHQDVPFERLVELLQPERTTSHAPLFQVIFTLQNMPSVKHELPDLTIKPYYVTESTAKYDLTVLMTEEGHRLTGTLEYNTGLFDEETMDRLVEHFEILLQHVVIHPERPVNSLDLLTETERGLLKGWNNTIADYPKDETISSLFGKSVTAYAQRQAVVGRPLDATGDICLSYQALHLEALHIGGRLADMGVRAGDRVGLKLARSHKMIGAMLGVLYAGGVYVPLDPEYPSERICGILEDSGCRFVIQDELGHSDDLPCQMVALQDMLVGLGEHNRFEPRSVSPDDPAYLLYTSGSTGRPKGVLVTHRNVVRLIKNGHHPFDFSERDVWVVAHSFCFDFSVWEMYGALLNGGCVVVADYKTVRNPQVFLPLLEHYRVTILNQTPAAFYNLVSHEAAAGVPKLHQHLRAVIFGGDRLDPTYLQPWVERYRLDQIRLVNMYGITETTVHVTHHTLTVKDIWGSEGQSIIGLPLPETEVYILNEAMQVQPLGVAGEIYVGGSGVSRGYWGRPELTAEKFLTVSEQGPLAHIYGVVADRLQSRSVYRSGDLGRWRADGTLEHLGRNDFQVQIRGFRIELGEIEQAILANQGADKVTVIAHGTGADKQLVAYVVPQEAVLRQLAAWEQQGELIENSVAELPNGRMVSHLNQSETLFLYDEIFVNNSYLRHGIEINAGDTIFDVGANIGMFSLFVSDQAADVVVYAFEPLPAAFECLQRNGRLHGLNLNAYQMGIGDRIGEASFTFYPHASILSGQVAEKAHDTSVRHTVRQFLEQQMAAGHAAHIETLLDERLQSEMVNARLGTLSQVIRDENIAQVDLLKIDVENGEQAVLLGIDSADWAKIKQIVLEVHDVDGALAWVDQLLTGKGFVVHTEQDATLTQTDLYNVYGVRPNRSQRVVQQKPVQKEFVGQTGFINQLRQQVQKRLPAYMLPANFVLLDDFPLTGNGKIDRAKLPLPNQLRSYQKRILPQTLAEHKMVGVWQELLGVDEIGVTDDFFALGGHSLLATQLMVRLPEMFGVNVPLGTIFDASTVAGLLEQIEALRWAAGLTGENGLGDSEQNREEGRL